MLVVSLRGTKFRILVSIGVFWAKRYYIQPWRSRLGLHAKRYKKYIFNMYIFHSFYYTYSIHLSVFKHGLF